MLGAALFYKKLISGREGRGDSQLEAPARWSWHVPHSADEAELGGQAGAAAWAAPAFLAAHVPGVMDKASQGPGSGVNLEQDPGRQTAEQRHSRPQPGQ